MKNSKFTEDERELILIYAKNIQNTFSNKSLFRAIRYTITYALPYWNIPSKKEIKRFKRKSCLFNFINRF